MNAVLVLCLAASVSFAGEPEQQGNVPSTHTDAAEAIKSVLDAGQSVPAIDIKDVVKAYLATELEYGEGKRPDSLALIQEMIPHAKDDPMLHAWLYERAGDLLTWEERLEDAGRNYEAAQEILDSLNIDLAIRRVENLVKWGGVVLRQRDKDKADALYNEAKRYPYWLANARGDASRRLREAHERAIMGLIRTRSGDAHALKRIRLIGAMEGFQPLIDKQIEVAEGDRYGLDEPYVPPRPTDQAIQEFEGKQADLYGTKSESVGVQKTGQTISFAAADDGDLMKGRAWPNPRFTDHGNGTVTDHLTGLIWLRHANAFGRRNWSEALADCAELEDGVHGLRDGSAAGDWRLPNVRELQSLIDYGRYIPALPLAHPFVGERYEGYWTSSTVADKTSSAWRVSLGQGIVYHVHKGAAYYVWPVRGKQTPEESGSESAD